MSKRASANESTWAEEEAKEEEEVELAATAPAAALRC